MSHEIARTPEAGLSTAAATAAVTASVLQGGAAGLNAFARYRVRRWLSVSSEVHCQRAQQFGERLILAIAHTTPDLPAEYAGKIHEMGSAIVGGLAESYSKDRFRGWVVEQLVAHPTDGILGASERLLRQYTQPLLDLLERIEAVSTEPSKSKVGALRAEIISSSIETLKLDITPRQGLNLDRQARHRTWIFVASIFSIAATTLLWMVVRTEGLIPGLRFIFHTLMSPFRHPHH
jgi:hypothetical protein